MVPYKRFSEDQVFSGINITPFTDIVLVLLIIFMIAAPGLLNTGLDISLPGSSTAEAQSQSRVTVGLDKEGTIYFEGERTPREAVRTKLEELVAKRKDISVVLNADSSAQHGLVIELLDMARAAGIKNIYVGTIPK
ncbi:MAG: biopolymer transporter ExbD [Spirochaetia bacterium]|nr:biopolymer transporter ExbD [Spirochaetia bacterium]